MGDRIMAAVRRWSRFGKSNRQIFYSTRPMTDAERAAFDKAFEAMDVAFAAMDKAFNQAGKGNA